MDLGANGQLQLSDRILFDNGGPNVPAPIATINFLSDDEQGNLPPGFLPPYPLLIPPVPETAPAVITIPIIDLTTNLAFPLTATMISDLEPAGTNLRPNLSDGIHLQIPEPCTIAMAGIGLLALAAIAGRRRRLKRSR
jgi:MYXO-CTERM domain-containing protein